MVKQLAVRKSILIHNIKDGTECQAANRFISLILTDWQIELVINTTYIAGKKSWALVGSLSILQWSSKSVAIIV